MKLQKIILTSLIILPLTTFAHLLEITATRDFPSKVADTSVSTALFKIKNISTIDITPVNQSDFPDDSGLSVKSSTCNHKLAPKQSCIIELSLKALDAGKEISTSLKIWAKPSADAVKYPIKFKVTASLPDITITPVNFSNPLPLLREPVVAEHDGKWLVLSGSLGNLHDFERDFNDRIYVYDPIKNTASSVLISDTNLNADTVAQLASTAPEFLQDGDTLYIIGGFYNTIPNDDTAYTTLNTISSFNVPGIINEIILHSTDTPPILLDQYVHKRTDIPQFKVTGGQLGKIGNSFYLAYGQDCEGGDYCEGGQTYTNSVYEFTMNPTLSTITITNTVTHAEDDGSGWRRRDYTLVPFRLGNTETLFAMGGPFTPGANALVWTNGIMLYPDLVSYNDNFINQQANQYVSPRLPMYSDDRKTMYSATFSGFSNLYWDQSHHLSYDITTPYGNILDLIVADDSGHVQEYANLTPLCSGQPLANCLYMGLGTEFIGTGDFYDHRHILQIDQLPQDKSTLVGYLYAGIVSNEQNIFDDPPNPTNNWTTNQIYAVYVKPKGSGSVKWQNVTDLFE